MADASIQPFMGMDAEVSTNHLYKWLNHRDTYQNTSFLKAIGCKLEMVADRFLKTSLVKLVGQTDISTLQFYRFHKWLMPCPTVSIDGC
jgi:hypothetical protein